jgi:hypothetical protein
MFTVTLFQVKNLVADAAACTSKVAFAVFPDGTG